MAQGRSHLDDPYRWLSASVDAHPDDGHGDRRARLFSADGKTIWYDLQTPKSQVFWLASVEIATGTRTRYSVEREHWSVHFNQSPDGTMFAGDGGGPSSVAAPGNGQWIYLFRPANGKLGPRSSSISRNTTTGWSPTSLSLLRQADRVPIQHARRHTCLRGGRGKGRVERRALRSAASELEGNLLTFSAY